MAKAKPKKYHIKTRISNMAWKPMPKRYVRLAPMSDAYMEAMMMHDVGECRLVYDLWFFNTHYKTWKPFKWFMERGGGFFICTCEQWRENESLKAEDKMRKGKLVRVAFRKPLSQDKLQAIMAATYPKIRVLGPVTALSTGSPAELQQQYGQYAPFFSPPFSPTHSDQFQCCQGMRGGDSPRCLDCEVSGFRWRDVAFPELHECEPVTGRTGTEVMAGCVTIVQRKK